MLFFAAAILYSSVHVLGVAGPVPVPADAVTTSFTAVSDTTPRVSISDPAPGVSGRVPVDGVTKTLSAPVEGVPATSSSLSGCGAVHGRATALSEGRHLDVTRCLDQLATASRQELAVFGRSFDLDAGDDVGFATALGEDGSARRNAAWWATLAEGRRDLLTTSMPGVVGNLEGVPYSDRNTANRITLASTLHTLERRAARGASTFDLFGTRTQRLTMLQQVKLALTPGRESDTAKRQLVSLDTVFPGRAAVSVGDLDTADNVSVMVPGMLYTVSNQITFWTDRAAAMHVDQDFWSSDLATTTSKPETSAVVAWMGYRTPDLTSVLGLDLAQAGAVHLEDTVLGLDAVRADDPPRVTVMAHSYGSTTAMIALTSHTIHVDDLVVLGSPGSVAKNAAALAVTAGHVYAAAAALDPVAGSAVFGADPGASDFGATLLNVAAGTDPFTEQPLTGTLTHNSYFVPGSQSMRNLALIGIGRGDLADGRAPDPNRPALVSSPSLAYVRPQDVFRD